MNKFKSLNIKILVSTIIFSAWAFQQSPANSIPPTAKPVISTKKAIADSITTRRDSLSTKPDSVIPKQKKQEPIDAVIDYSANDSIVFLGNGTGILYGKGEVKYKKIDLKAHYIRVKMDSSTVFAVGKQDSTGKTTDDPIFKDEGQDYSSKNMIYNLKSKRGYIRQAVTKQGEGYILSDKTKKNTEDMLCVADGKYTTCDNNEHPDFYLHLSEAKIKPGQYIVTGPANLVVADVPLPLYIPFGYFPFTNKYSSGVIMPSYDINSAKGVGFLNGGYYFALSDYADLEMTGEIYTRGSWALRGNSKYLKKYKYYGNFNFNYREDISGEKMSPNFSKSNSMGIYWKHTQDPKVNPYTTFSSDVNFSTSGFNRSNIINNYGNPAILAQNTKSSTINFNQRFPDNPFTINGSLSIDQRSQDSTMSIALPNIYVSMSKINPFRRKEVIGTEKWYEKISITYNGDMENRVSNVKENKFFASPFTSDWKNGVKHSIPVSATFTLLKYINFTPSVSYTERWYFKKVRQQWDTINNKVRKDTTNGFNRVYDFSGALSLSTKLYGFYVPIRAIFGDKVDRIRHMITPSVSINYRPDFGDQAWGYYGHYVMSTTDSKGEKKKDMMYSYFEGQNYGTPGSGKSGSIGFQIGNNVEMKVKNSKDTTGTKPFNKISLIDNFTVSGSYNLIADSMNWSNFNATLRLKLTENNALALNGVFDPYLYHLDYNGKPYRANDLCWNHGKFPRFLGTGTSYSYTLNNETFSKKTDKAKPNKVTTSTENKLPTSNTPLKDSTNNTPTSDADRDGYKKIKIPWSISFGYTVNYAPSFNILDFNYQTMEYKMILTHGLTINGNLALTSNWNITGSTSYDFILHQLINPTFNVTRKLHCWTMTAMVIPFGPYQMYTFRIGVNASMLKDLKYDKRSIGGANNTTWY